MKKTTIAIIVILAISFVKVNAQGNKVVTIKEFLNGILILDNEKINTHSPIISVYEIASKRSAKKISITKDNIDASLKEAKGYKYCIIIVGNHTIVKVTDFNKSILSGSWGVRMPFGEGYTQKGSLTNVKDYLNNIIGKPDAQTRMMFLFN